MCDYWHHQVVTTKKKTTMRRVDDFDFHLCNFTYVIVTNTGKVSWHSLEPTLSMNVLITNSSIRTFSFHGGIFSEDGFILPLSRLPL